MYNIKQKIDKKKYMKPKTILYYHYIVRVYYEVSSFSFYISKIVCLTAETYIDFL